jgi:FdhD protein
MVMDEHPAIRVERDTARRVMDHVVKEERFYMYLNNKPLTEQIASPENLEELGAGFVICEGIAEHVESVRASGNEIWIEADAVDSMEWEYRTCGGCGIHRVPRKVHSSLMISPDDIFTVIGEIESEVWQKTGGVHCSVLFHEGSLLAKRCDIGRHNTVDKVIGYAELHGIDRSSCYIGCTGRQPEGMVSKSANAGIPIIISRAASTNRGILTAEETGITLVCFSRDHRFTVYANPERIRGILNTG